MRVGYALVTAGSGWEVDGTGGEVPLVEGVVSPVVAVGESGVDDSTDSSTGSVDSVTLASGVVDRSSDICLWCRKL